VTEILGSPASPTCDRSTLTGLGIQLAGKIWYHALLLKTPTWRYREARSATLTAARRLFPGSCTVFDKVKAAWKAVSVPTPRNEPACTTRHTKRSLHTNTARLGRSRLGLPIPARHTK